MPKAKKTGTLHKKLLKAKAEQRVAGVKDDFDDACDKYEKAKSAKAKADAHVALLEAAKKCARAGISVNLPSGA